MLIGAGLGWGTPRVITGVSLWIHKVARMEVDSIAARIPRFCGVSMYEPRQIKSAARRWFTRGGGGEQPLVFLQQNNFFGL